MVSEEKLLKFLYSHTNTKCYEVDLEHLPAFTKFRQDLWKALKQRDLI